MMEEVTKVANNLISSLSTSPLILALVLFNLAFVGVTAYNNYSTRGSMERLIAKMFDQQAETQKLLYNCVPGTKPLVFEEDNLNELETSKVPR